MNQSKRSRLKLQPSIIFSSLCFATLIGCDQPPSPTDRPPQSDNRSVAGSEETSKNESPTAENPKIGSPENPSFSYAILHWNVESGGNDPATVAAQLVELGKLGEYDVIGLSEVNAPEAYELALNQQWPDRYQFIRGLSGTNEDREDDHLWVAFDTESFDLVSSQEMKEVGGFVFDDGHHRVPLYVRLKDKTNRQEIVFILNHLARGDKEFRQLQAKTLREWARTKSIPIVAIGDYNLDFVFESQKGNLAFGEFMRDGVWKWIRPEPLIDTNWSDYDGDGIDNYIDSLLDFSFVAGAAKTWNASSRVIVRENDFPDDDQTSDHRPVELILNSD